MTQAHTTQQADKQWRLAQRMTNVRAQVAQMRYVPRAIGIVWSAAPGWASLSVAVLAVQSLLPVASVYLTRLLVNALVAVSDSRGARADVVPAVTYAALIGAVMLLMQLLTVVGGYVRAGLAERVQTRVNRLIHDKATALDLQHYESRTYFDQLQRASVDAIDRPLGIVDSLSSLLQHIITLTAMAGVLLTFAWWLPLALLAGALPAFVFALRATIEFHARRLKNTVNQRWLSYYHNVVLTDRFAAELRLFNLGGMFIAAYDALRAQLQDERMALLRKQTLLQLGATLFGFLVVGLCALWVVWLALQGVLTLGALAMFAQTLNQGQAVTQRLLGGATDTYRNLAFLEDLFIFLALQPTVRDPAHPVSTPELRQGIQLDAITFSYPDGASPVLRDFSLHIPAGQIVALVGQNGTGKSTLLKLLCRFYDPQGGRITWDGIDLRKMAQGALRRRISILFQQPFPYHSTAADNIRLGDQAGAPTQARIEQAAHAGGAASVIEKLPEGYDTLLGKSFGRAELSVGEWQRIALARAFVRQADLVILDEPTSAMDPWAEHDWMNRFRDLVSGRTALIITHRFTTAMQADVIHVMDQGRVVESGSHAELVALGGRYALSWQQQLQGIESARLT